MPYEMLTSLTSRLYLSWELFTQGILILVPGSFFQLPLPLLFSRLPTCNDVCVRLYERWRKYHLDWRLDLERLEHAQCSVCGRCVLVCGSYRPAQSLRLPDDLACGVSTGWT